MGYNWREYKPPSDIKTLNFDSLIYSHVELYKMVIFMFEDLGLFDKFKINVQKFWLLLKEISTRYHENQYHRFSHAIDITQYAYIILLEKNVSEILSDFDKLTLLIGCLFHDVDHPGKFFLT
jgi:hypothetical protein